MAGREGGQFSGVHWSAGLAESIRSGFSGKLCLGKIKRQKNYLVSISGLQMCLYKHACSNTPSYNTFTKDISEMDNRKPIEENFGFYMETYYYRTFLTYTHTHTNIYTTYIKFPIRRGNILKLDTTC